jgi:hypothetical protein
MGISRDSKDKKRDKLGQVGLRPFESEWHAITTSIRSIQRDTLGGTIDSLFREIYPNSTGAVVRKMFSGRVPSEAVRQAVINGSATYFYKRDQSRSVEEWKELISKKAHALLGVPTREMGRRQDGAHTEGENILWERSQTFDGFHGKREHTSTRTLHDAPSSSGLELIRETLIARLKRDQSESGIHAGQFGKTTDPDNEERFLTGRENLSTKPRIYLTLWPAVILRSRGLLIDQVALALDGLCSLFSRDRIRVFQAAPRQSPPQLEASLVSYRHTIGAALLVYYLRGWVSVVRNIVSSMLDQRNRWQNSDGGWAQCDREHVESDIWGSAYAVRLIAKLLQDAIATKSQSDSIEMQIKRALAYFRGQWETNRWAVGASSSEENSMLILIEIAPILRLYEPKLLSEVISHLRTWLSPLGQLSETYMARCPGNSLSALHARVAYALYRAGEGRNTWMPLFHVATENLSDKFNSSDMAFIVDLSYAAEDSNGALTII